MLDFLKERPFVILISIIWGLGLSCMFRQACVGRDCIVIKAPHPGRIVGKVFKDPGGKKCYSYIPQSAVCNQNPILP